MAISKMGRQLKNKGSNKKSVKLDKKSIRSIKTQIEHMDPFPKTISSNVMFPKEKKVKLTMCDLGRLVFGGTTGVVYEQFRANSVNSPGVTYTRHQPMYYDQYVPIYTKACVYKTVFDITFSNDSTGDTYIVGMGNQSGSSTPTYSSYLDILYDIERGNLNAKTIGPGQKVRVRRTIVPVKQFGVSGLEYNDDQFCEQVSTTINTYSPSYQTPVTVYGICSDTTATTPLSYSIKIVYHTKFWERKAVAHS